LDNLNTRRRKKTTANKENKSKKKRIKIQFKRRAAGEIQTQSQIGCSINAADWQSSTPLPHRSSGGIPIPPLKVVSAPF